MLNRTLLALVLCLSCLWGFGQVKLQGEVTHNGKPVDQVTIQVYENGRLQRTIAASKRGKYDMEFPLQHRYLLVFQRPFMIPVRILVNTNIAPQGKDAEPAGTVYDVPLNMEVYYRFDGLDVSAYDGPIGEVSPAGKGENTFAFHPDRQRLEEVKALNELSMRMENEGAKPMNVAEDPERDLDWEPKGAHRVPPAESGTEAVNVDEKKNTPEMTVHEREEALRMERQAGRYDQIEQAKKENSARARDIQIKSQEVNTNRDDARENYVLESKQTRSEVLARQGAEEEKKLDAKVEKQERLMSGVEYAARLETTSSRSSDDRETYGISRKQEPGWFYSEEILRVSECGTKNEYKRVTYDWLLFEANYYYLNDSEISQEMYEEAKKLFE